MKAHANKSKNNHISRRCTESTVQKSNQNDGLNFTENIRNLNYLKKKRKTGHIENDSSDWFL